MTNKVLFLTHYSSLYGSNMSMDSIVRYFKSKDIDVAVLFPNKDILYNQMKKDDISVFTFRFFYEVLYVKLKKKYLVLPLLWLYDILAFPFLLLKIRRINPSMIYTNSSCNIFGLWIARALGIQHVQHVREFMKEDFGASYIFGRNAKKKHILKSDKIIYVSKDVARGVTDGVPNNGAVIYNGVKTPNLVKDIKPFNTELRLGIIGYLDKAKQQDLAISYMAEIVKKFPNITLRIIGDRETPYKYSLIKQVKDLCLESNVVFEGFIKGEDNIYDKIDVVFMCSRREGFGRVTVEAMRRNIPVIGLDAGGTSELIEDGVTGFKFKNCNDVLDAINILINNPNKTSDIIRKAKEKADLMFDESKYAEKVYSFVFNKI